ncbi:subtilisin-like protease SBT4.3 isoform X2 [Euphorbia lathyris]|uniref:subtilisin-like protease SBT4.3 isoform X2 n=1 Tax=Euphorbia lathyris TaxID=212925 RepID=UPI003313E774
MAKIFKSLHHCFSIGLIFIVSLLRVTADGDRKLHIVYMGSLPPEEYSLSSHHLSLLQGITGTSNAENLLLRSYNRSFNGFAAMLFDSEAKQLASSKKVVSVIPSGNYQLHTTRSWSFVGFEETAHRNPGAESDLVIGVLDTGIWPESESFNDEGFGPPPKKWKGSCLGGNNFSCNNKLIGARNYIKIGPTANTARDYAGHGTHTASTAVGRNVKDASFFGLANDILGAFDDAIADGVDIITISVGAPYPHYNYTDDVIAIGAFHAMEKGIFTSQSAGNSGPDFGSISSLAPWILSVGASSTDRRILDKVILGNKKELIGNSVNSFDLKGQSFPVINGSNAKAANCSDSDASFCRYSCLNESIVKGKIVVCENAEGYTEAYRTSAVGCVLQSNGMTEDVSYTVPLPSITLSYEKFVALRTYMNSIKDPVAQILKSEAVKDSTAPLVASFSSRGPNMIVPDLLKPDVVAPGIDILAAFSPNAPPSIGEDRRRVKYNIKSGTSMACPHAAAVAAYVKTFNPNWSPAAIQSALITTAFPMNTTGNSDTELAYGSGLINPSRAVNPGLVYDAGKEDYLTFLCSIGYNESSIRLVSGNNSTTCPRGSDKASPRNLNYPSMSARVAVNKSFTLSFIRTVTNVGLPKSIYRANVWSNSKLINIKVVPEEFSFESINEKKSFNVTVSSGGLPDAQIVSSALVWYDGSHIVRSPIVVYTFGVE